MNHQLAPLTSKQQVWYLIGASGTGKSTAAFEIAAQLKGSTHVISTDVVRAGLRKILSNQECPELFAESFNVPWIEGEHDVALAVECGDEAPVNLDGFLRQCEPVCRYVEAAVEYCIMEGWNCVVEGVHLVPETFQIPIITADVECHARLYEARSQQDHKHLFDARDVATSGRRSSEHYCNNIQRIAVVQKFLESRWISWTSSAKLQSIERIASSVI